MPLVLVTTINNHGITNIIGGCLLSDERYDSYLWVLQQFHSAVQTTPVVIFSDGETELARAIRETWPNRVHLLCRFHIAQNITRALAPLLRARLNQFMQEFWIVASIENMEEYQGQFNKLHEAWPEADNYLSCVKAKQEKWAFVYTHVHFVAGIASTKRQEMENCQVEASLISNSTLSRIVDGFDNVDKSTAAKLVKASLNTKLVLSSNDPIIKNVLPLLTAFAGALVKEESTLSLSYTCIQSESGNTFLVSHKDHPSKSRAVTVANESLKDAVCSCRKQIWYGIVCRHIFCTFRN